MCLLIKLGFELVSIIFAFLSLYYTYKCSEINPFDHAKKPEIYKNIPNTFNSIGLNLLKVKKAFEFQGDYNKKAISCILLSIIFHIFQMIHDY